MSMVQPHFLAMHVLRPFIKENRGWNGGGTAQELSKMDGHKDTENQHLDCFMLLHLGCETNNDKIRKRDTMSKCLSAAGA